MSYFTTDYLSRQINKKEGINEILDLIDDIKENPTETIKGIKNDLEEFIKLHNLCPECYEELDSDEINEIIIENYSQPIVQRYCEHCGYSNVY